jgi:FixJ family two-component response regulator
MKMNAKTSDAFLRKSLRLYVIDDDFAVRESSMILCEPLNLPSFSFGSGEEFISHLQQDPYPCGTAIIDLWLTGMTGLAVLQHLAAYYPGIVPILITGFGDLGQITAATAGSKVRVIPKPYVGDTFWEAVVESLELARRQCNDGALGERKTRRVSRNDAAERMRA